MKKPESDLSATYRCPVCGHGDTVEVDGQVVGGRIVCSYCAAQLEVSGREPRAGRLTVRLADAVISG